ncbi:hypothetical protein C3489_28880 [Streptomyces sp. Ru71]|uniref:hypothetical protein n=1 Tax=Streptomyces sp. Ru71 TaxID=2080746 RepID=UPI000CDDB6B2|nr:hypothetical protein [Streptomyces sp. Ru71]POX47701.1 hypothetical protein C3489_28880 [Streptomyces sp. Ru71]
MATTLAYGPGSAHVGAKVTTASPERFPGAEVEPRRELELGGAPIVKTLTLGGEEQQRAGTTIAYDEAEGPVTETAPAAR